MRHLDFYCGSLTVMRILTAVYPGAESLRARANQSPMQYFETLVYQVLSRLYWVRQNDASVVRRVVCANTTR